MYICTIYTKHSEPFVYNSSDLYCNVLLLAQEFARGQSRGLRVQIVKGAYFPIHPDSRQRIHIFSPDRECTGNYIPNSRVVLTVYNFNTLLLFKKNG